MDLKDLANKYELLYKTAQFNADNFGANLEREINALLKLRIPSCEDCKASPSVTVSCINGELKAHATCNHYQSEINFIIQEAQQSVEAKLLHPPLN